MTREEIVSNGNKAFIREVSDGGKANVFVVGYIACANEYEKRLAELKKRNGGLAGQKASLERWLGEAISVIKKFSEFLNSDVEYDPEHSQEHTNLWNELCERAERFLKEFIPPEV